MDKEKIENEKIDTPELSAGKDGVGDECVKKPFYSTLPFAIAAGALAVIIIFWIAIGITVATTNMSLRDIFGIKPKRLDYINGDLSDYISLEDDDYKGYDIVIDIAKPTMELDVQQRIIELIKKNRGEALNGYKYQYDVTINPADRVFIYYAAYEIDDNGERREIPSVTNFNKKEPLQLTIGSGDFPLGVELGLIGTNPKDTPEFKASTGGYVSEGDTVYLTASYITADGIVHAEENIRIDLTDPGVEDKWGIGILDYLQEKSMGQVNSNPISLDAEFGRIYYTEIRIDYVTKCEAAGNAITVEAVYSHDPEDESLRNKRVFFDIFIEKVMCYDSPEFNDAFITDVLEIDEDTLAGYEGQTLTEKYKSYTLDVMLQEYEELCREEAEILMWDYLKRNLNYSLPAVEYDQRYSEYYKFFEKSTTEENEKGYGAYSTVDDYIIAYYGLDEEEDVGEFLRATVKDEVYEKLILFSIARREGLLPAGDELESIYNEAISAEFEYYYGKGADEYSSVAEYEKALAEYEKTIKEYYGEDHCMYLLVYYDIVVDAMIDMANVIKE